jgi:hypothetical protein
MATGCSQIVARKRKRRPSVDAAHAVDGYLLDEQLGHFGNFFLFRVRAIVGHFIKTFLARASELFLST